MGSGGASTDGGGALCSGNGWCRITNTKLRDVCPDRDDYPAIQGNSGCASVVDAWSGAVADTMRNRLVMWGGGHGDYFGNELYALDLNTRKMLRLNEPSNVDGYDKNDCYAPVAYSDGRPASRHTYDGLSYVAHSDQMWAFSGAKVPCGYQGSDTWLLNLAAVETTGVGSAAPWSAKNAAGTGPTGSVGVISDYDTSSRLVIMSDLEGLFSYDAAANRYARLSSNATMTYTLTGRVDPKRHLFIVIGSGSMLVYDLGDGKNHDKQDWTASVSGCSGLINPRYAGFAYDPDRDKMVGWAGGDTAYIFDVDAKRCEPVTHAGGPGNQNSNGTMGRFRYFPALKVFAVVNRFDEDAYTLRLAP
jgi:hypothetical protein